MANIRTVVVEGNREQGYRRVQVLFGTNSFIEITDDGGRINLLVGAHDRGFTVDGSEANGKLQRLVEQICQQHPEYVWQEE